MIVPVSTLHLFFYNHKWTLKNRQVVFAAHFSFFDPRNEDRNSAVKVRLILEHTGVFPYHYVI